MFKTEANKVVYYENGMALAYVSYPFISENTVDINHTIVDSKLQGKGIASQLLEYAYNDIKEKNIKAELSCSYAIKWFNKHPEYDDILFDGIRKYQDRDFNALYNITKGYWADEVPMSLELTDFIYDFLIKYYLYNNEYCYVGLSKGQVGAFLLSNTRNEVNESERYFKENIHKLSESDQKKAYEYYEYINYNHNKVLTFMPQNSIYLGLIASKIHSMGSKLIEQLKNAALKNNIKDIYLWTDETCCFKYYENHNFKLIDTYFISLYSQKIKTFIYKMNF